jgi:hypothetical protein
MAQAFARRPFEALSDELQRMSYAIAAAVDVLDAGVLEPRDRERLIARLQRRVRYAVGTLARSEAQALHFIPALHAVSATT